MTRLDIVTTNRFRKNYKKICRYKNFNKIEFEKILEYLSFGKKLDKKYKDHNLTGNMKDFRECHIASDILLIYKIEKEILILTNIGNHSNLFS